MAFAEPNINEKIHFYKIQGNSGQELKKQMDTLGPKTNAQQFNASTKWIVTWQYGYQEKNHICQLTSLKVDLHIHYLYPRWVNYQSSHPTLQQKWNVCLKDLNQHEKGHGKNGKNAATAVEKALLNIPPKTSCQQLMITIDNTANYIIQEYLNKDFQYDQHSQHGRV
jgi:predicted secreted Zn-dependent protease